MKLYCLQLKEDHYGKFYNRQNSSWQSSKEDWMTKQELEELYDREPSWRGHHNVNVLTKTVVNEKPYKPAKRRIKL